MKKILLTLVIALLTLTSFSQEVKIKKVKDTKYSFGYTISMNGEKVDRYKSRLMDECVEIKNLKIKNGICIVEFKKQTPQERVDKILLYVTSTFNYTSYIITK